MGISRLKRICDKESVRFIIKLCAVHVLCLRTITCVCVCARGGLLGRPCVYLRMAGSFSLHFASHGTVGVVSENVMA